MAITVKLTGAERILAKIHAIERKLEAPTELRVGFFEGAKYPKSNLPVPAVAAINEFGATVKRQAGDVTTYHMTNAAGTKFLRKGRFVKASKANLKRVYKHGAYVIKIPSRPFFRTMIKLRQKTWAPVLSAQLKRTQYDVKKSVKLLGLAIETDLKTSIISWMTPPNAASTIRKKGFDKPLIHTSLMVKSTGVEVS
jgi:hypothetical protein